MVDVLGYIGLGLLAVGLLGIVFGLIAMTADVLGWHSGIDIVATGFFCGAGALFLGMLFIAPAVIMGSEQRRDAFMAACLQDRKEYECTAMWRAGDGHTTVMPMPIIVPSR